MIMMIKRNDDLYVLIAKINRIHRIISELSKKDYDFMLEHFKRIRNCDDETVKEYGNACYYFPKSQRIQGMLYQRSIDDYCIKVNELQQIVSEMIGVEMDMMIFELECLPNHQCGTPAYFPPPKEKNND